jgi:hypothetical protein
VGAVGALGTRIARSRFLPPLAGIDARETGGLTPYGSVEDRIIPRTSMRRARASPQQEGPEGRGQPRHCHMQR